MDTHEAFVRTPLSILHDNNLSDAAFRLYLEIFGLSEASKKGYCWATNRTLAENFGKSPRSVIRALSELEEKGYIRKEETRNELTKQVTERRIYPLKKSSPPTKKKSRPIKENVTPLVTEIADPSPQNCHTPYDENGTENRYNTIEHTIEQPIFPEWLDVGSDYESLSAEDKKRRIIILKRDKLDELKRYAEGYGIAPDEVDALVRECMEEHGANASWIDSCFR